MARADPHLNQDSKLPVTDIVQPQTRWKHIVRNIPRLLQQSVHQTNQGGRRSISLAPVCHPKRSLCLSLFHNRKGLGLPTQYQPITAAAMDIATIAPIILPPCLLRGNPEYLPSVLPKILHCFAAYLELRNVNRLGLGPADEIPIRPSTFSASSTSTSSLRSTPDDHINIFRMYDLHNISQIKLMLWILVDMADEPGSSLIIFTGQLSR